MAVMQPWNANVDNPDFFNIVGTAATPGRPIDFRKAKVIFVHVIFASATNTGAKITVQGSQDPLVYSSPGSASWVDMVPTTNYPSTGFAPTITAGVLTIPSATAGSVILVYEHTPGFVRYNYAVTTGGGAVVVYAMGRAT